MSASRNNSSSNPSKLEIKSPNDYKHVYMKKYANYVPAFTYYLDQILVPSDATLKPYLRAEIIQFYAQVLHWFNNPTSKEVIAAFNQLETDIKNHLSIIKHKAATSLADYHDYETLFYAESESATALLWPIFQTNLFTPLEFGRCMHHVLLKKLQSIGLNQELDPNLDPLAYFYGIVPLDKAVQSLLDGIWFKEFSTTPEGDTSRHGAWSHCIQLYIAISLYEQKIIQLGKYLSILDLFKLSTTTLRLPMPGLVTLFDVVFEQRDQQELLMNAYHKEKADTQQRHFFASLFQKLKITSTHLSHLVYEPPFYGYGLTSPAFLSSFISVMRTLKIADVPLLTILWVHKQTKLNFYSAQRANPENINLLALQHDANIVTVLVNNPAIFFKNAPKATLAEVDLSKYDCAYKDPDKNCGIFYRKK